MAIRLDKAIVSGEISNEIRGLVTGLVWVCGQEKPIRIRLSGNCLRDLAGCAVKFENPHPEFEEVTDLLAEEQEGVVGDMTASRRAKVPTVTEAEIHDLLSRKQPVPSVTANTLYLEWFSESNGRVVIETTHCRVTVSEPAWLMTEEEEQVQEAESQQNFYSFLDKITGNGSPQSGAVFRNENAADDEGLLFGVDDDLEDGDADASLPEDIETEDDIDDGENALPFDSNVQPLDEFEWERELREADRKAAAYQEALEKYKDSPERDKLVAEAMGWDDGDEADLDFDWEEVEFRAPAEFLDSPQSVLGEISPENDQITGDELNHHPLSRRVTDLALHLQQNAELRGLLAMHDPVGAERMIPKNPYLSVVIHIIALGGKLAAALDGTVHGIDPEPGFVIAMLKRAQIPLNEALHAIGSLFTGHLDENTADWLEYARSELFDLRNEILEIMRELRTGQ